MPSNPEDSLKNYPLLAALHERRSRRFCLGMKMPGGPLAYHSKYAPQPLTEKQEAALVFAAAGFTGPAMADLCYAREHSGNMMTGFAGRTAGSGDAIQTVALIVTNDDATYLVKRPRDFSPSELAELIALGQRGEYVEFYRRVRVKIKGERCAPPLEPLFNIQLNRWAAYAPGTTYFLPVNDLTMMYINGLLEVLNDQTGAFVLDERANFLPAGIGQFAKKKGGHLDENPHHGKVATVGMVERMVTEFVTVEQGMMLQNLGLMAQALGLAGYPNFANHEFGWFQALGFRMGEMPASQYLGAGKLVTLGMNLLRQNPMIPYPIGLEVDGEPVLKPFCPPYYPSMKAAVEAVVELKRGERGWRHTPPWSKSEKMVEDIPRIGDAAIAATIAYCEYIWARYGRFPAQLAPYRTVVGFQAGRIDADFYDRFYAPSALAEPQRADFRSTTGA